jgi:uncharacterized protein (TIGR03382 family)
MRAVKRIAVVILVTACAEPELGTREQAITTAVRHERFGLIRDAAAEMGLHNAPLLAGVAISETQLAHCQSEATYACKGPASPSCGGGPIIAGSADGPCGDMQGGLGMFQFDSGTYAQTISTYGDSILTIEGNTAQAVNFVVVRAQQNIAEAKDWLTSVGWMNDVVMKSGTATMEEWASFIVCRYNGCCTASSTCTTRRNDYRDNAIDAYNEMGAEFWDTSNRCTSIPPGGVIDQRSNCYIAGGDPRFWRRESGGYDDTREWTGTTDAGAPANFGRWIVKAKSGSYSVDVNLDGGDLGTSKTAKYVVRHAGTSDTVMIDQTSASGWVSLGEFEFSGSGDEYIQLGDNTGESGAMDRQLLFDAVRVLSPDDPGTDATGGCCDSSGQGGATGTLGALFVGLVVRRRRRPRA